MNYPTPRVHKHIVYGFKPNCLTNTIAGASPKAKPVPKPRKPIMQLDTPKNHSFYHRYHPKAGPVHHPFIGLDFEDDSNGNFVCAGLFGDIGPSGRVNQKEDEKPIEQHIEEYFTNKKKLHDYLLSLDPLKCILAFYNLRYDQVYLKEITDESQTIKNSGGAVVEIVLTNGLKCWDMANHAGQGTSLDDWIRDLHMTEKYGVYKADLKNKKERVMNDAKATYYLASYLEDEYVYKFGIPIKPTSGMNAVQYYAEKYFTDKWERLEKDKHIGDIAKDAFYGPRNENWDTNKKFNYRYDINGAYAWVMANQLFPDPSSFVEYKYTAKWRQHLKQYPCGIFHVRVKAPKVKVMVLPVRNKKGELYFPHGTFTGTWTNAELKLALDNGYKVLKCYYYVIYRKAKPYFQEVAWDYWNRKIAYAKEGNKAMAGVMKGAICRLFGKFAQQNLVKRDYTINDIDDLADAGIPFRISPDGKQVFVNSVKEPTRSYFPEIPAFITSYLRCYLFSILKQNEATLTYCACDSVHATESVKGITVGEGLGEWKEEMKGNIQHFNAGNYQWEEDGKPAGHIRSVPTKKAVLTGLDEDGKQVWEYIRPLKEAEAQRQKLKPNTWLKVKRHISLIDYRKNKDLEGYLWPKAFKEINMPLLA